MFYATTKILASVDNKWYDLIFGFFFFNVSKWSSRRISIADYIATWKSGIFDYFDAFCLGVSE